MNLCNICGNEQCPTCGRCHEVTCIAYRDGTPSCPKALQDVSNTPNWEATRVSLLNEEKHITERPQRRSEEMITSIETTMHNVNVIALHIKTCRNCKEEIEEDPTVQQHIDRYSTSHIALTEVDVHRTVYYHLCPFRLEGLVDENGNPLGVYHEEEE